MNFITEVCKGIGAFSAALVALSLMWVMLKMIFGADGSEGPPRGLWVGLFGIYIAGFLWIGSNLLLHGTLP